MNSDPAQIMYRDAFVLATVLGACAELLALNCGKQVHARVFSSMVLGWSLTGFCAAR